MAEILAPRIYITRFCGVMITVREALKNPNREYRCQYCSMELSLYEKKDDAWFIHREDKRPLLCEYDRVNKQLHLKAKSLDKKVEELQEVTEGVDWYCLLCHHYYTVRGHRRCERCHSGLYSILAHTLTEAHQRIFLSMK